MNAPDTFSTRLALTREPFPASRKVYLEGMHVEGTPADLRVPLREVSLSNGETVSLYDTSGPYTDPAVAIDVRRGLPDVRRAWDRIARRHRGLRRPGGAPRSTTA